MKKPTPNQIVGEFALEHSGALDLKKRAKLYRALAEMIGDEKDAARFIAMAKEFDAVRRKHRQLVLDFKRRAES